MKKIIFFLSLIIPVMVLSQQVVPTSTKNYTHKILYKKGYVVDSIDQATNDEKIESIQYYDGLGRPIQSRAVRQGGKDDIGNETGVIMYITYDALGRQVKNHLPISSSVNDGKFTSITETSINDFYDLKYADEWTSAQIPNPYSEKLIENSPLNRILKQAAPGEDWKLGNGNEIEFDYQLNTINDVKFYKVTLSSNYTPTLIDNGFYNINSLHKTITRDENYSSGTNHTTEEFKDKQGKVVLKRTYVDINGTSEKHDTYYVYDDYGNLTYVLPPKMNASTNNLSTINSQLDELGYQYKYDEKNRLIEKKIPGKGQENILYNKIDQPIFIQDYIQASKPTKEWLYTKYDVFGRVAYTGLREYNIDKDQYQLNINNSTASVFETTRTTPTTIAGTTIYYNTVSIPTTVNEIYTINYYDNYDFLGSESSISLPARNKYEEQIITTIKGLPSGNKVRILDTNDWITTVTGYDKHHRPIWITSKNSYLNTTDIIESKLDFTGKVEEITTTHKKDGELDIVIVEKFTYDHSGKLLNQTHKVGNQGEETIATNEYDDLGQLKRKKVGNNQVTYNELQVVDYKYNIRGWLKEINEVNNFGTTDLFAFKINYNKVDDDIYGQVDPLYNGNISETYWKTKNDNLLRGYGYAYDAQNRLKDALYEEPTSSDKYPGFYNTRFIDYDKNGNITYLKRYGKTTDDKLKVLDRLYYTYQSNSNKLVSVADTDLDEDGFYDGNTSGNDYEYDQNGNMTKDLNKGITNITYNHLNLPKTISINRFEMYAGTITYVYDATGVKLQKIVSDSSEFTTPEVTTTDYANSIVYENGNLQFISQAEGYLYKEGTQFKYVYQFKDHLGNIRISYQNIGTVSNPNLEIIEENNYYPFGLEHKGYNNVVSSNANSVASKFKYNGVEHEEALGLDLYEMDVRSYDPAIARFTSIDPVTHYSMSTYTAFDNNPVYWADPSGADATDLINDIWNNSGSGSTTWTNNNNGTFSGSNGASAGTQNCGGAGQPPCADGTTPPNFKSAKSTGEFYAMAYSMNGYQAHAAKNGWNGLTEDQVNQYDVEMAEGSFELLTWFGGGLVFKAIFKGGKWIYVAYKGSKVVRTGTLALKSFQYAGKYGIQNYSKLRAAIKGTGLQAHHLLEQRFASVLGTKASQMSSIALTKAEHQIFTNAWRAEIGYKGSNALVTTANATADDIYKAARKIYKNYPEILNALGL